MWLLAFLLLCNMILYLTLTLTINLKTILKLTFHLFHAFALHIAADFYPASCTWTWFLYWLFTDFMPSYITLQLTFILALAFELDSETDFSPFSRLRTLHCNWLLFCLMHFEHDSEADSYHSSCNWTWLFTRFTPAYITLQLTFTPPHASSQYFAHDFSPVSRLHTLHCNWLLPRLMHLHNTLHSTLHNTLTLTIHTLTIIR